MVLGKCLPLEPRISQVRDNLDMMPHHIMPANRIGSGVNNMGGKFPFQMCCLFWKYYHSNTYVSILKAYVINTYMIKHVHHLFSRIFFIGIYKCTYFYRISIIFSNVVLFLKLRPTKTNIATASDLWNSIFFLLSPLTNLGLQLLGARMCYKNQGLSAR